MSETFTSKQTKGGLTVKLWRGERMCLIGMNVDKPAADFVGFAIEVKGPNEKGFRPLNNRLAFAYDKPVAKAVTGGRWYSSLGAPFQKFRWIHFPDDPKGGKYTYRVTVMHMPEDTVLTKGDSLEVSIGLDAIAYDGFLDIGFTRNFASSQAYADRYMNNPKIIPTTRQNGLKFKKVSGDVYDWLGFEAKEMIFGILDEAATNHDISLDMLAYDFDEPDILAKLEKLGARLRIVIDDSDKHGQPTNAASVGAEQLKKSAGAKNVKRMHFKNLQHNKVLIVKYKSDATKNKVLFGSTNFSFRGLYIQANNAIMVQSKEAVGLFDQMFTLAFENAGTAPARWYTGTSIEKQWHNISVTGKPMLSFCFSPHNDSNLSLGRVGKAIEDAIAEEPADLASVFFSIAFLYQTKAGPVRTWIDKLTKSPTFSYGISDKNTGLEVYKPDGSIGQVDFDYLRAHSPEPFASEWSGGAGIHEHDKFVVTNFNKPNATVFTGSCNMSPSGEEGNGDNLVMIQDQRIATSYAIEALRIFDHLHFRVRMQDATGKDGKTKKSKTEMLKKLTLKKPTAISHEPAWFENYYKAGNDKLSDRMLFAT
jgi:hypothetical protein